MIIQAYIWLLIHRPHMPELDLSGKPWRESGQDLIEYAMLGGLIALALVAVITIFGGAIKTMGENIAKCIDFDGGTQCVAGP